MTPRKLLAGAVGLVTVPLDRADVVMAQYRALAQQLPVMHLIFISSTWMVAATHMAYAPWWLTIAAPALLTLGSATRILHWCRTRWTAPTVLTASRMVVRANWLSAPVAAVFTAWALCLFPYGGAYAQAHVVFYVAITTMGYVFSLRQLRSAAFIMIAIVNLEFAGFFASTGSLTLIAVALNMVLASIMFMILVFRNYRAFIDMVDGLRAEERIHRLAHQDALTGLPNRASFLEQLERSLADPEGALGLLYIDLDGFKFINDGRGHHAGDELLRQVARRLDAQCLRAQGMSLGRIGGDEFAALLRNTSEKQVGGMAARLVDALSVPYVLEKDAQVRIGASVGCVLTTRRGESAAALLAHADMALYAAKAAGKGTYRLFTEDMENHAQERLRLETQLQAALHQERDIFVFYQPIVDIASRQVTAREALLRWHNPGRGWVSPQEFIQVAEGSGLIDQIGRFVLRQACREAMHWPDGASVAVNVSAAQLGRGTLVPAIVAALSEAGLQPPRLEIEVTETALLREDGAVVAELRQVRAMGVRIALDDFGTGFSSLAHVRIFPFDKIKIDGSFVRDALDRPDCAAVVQAIADLGKSLGVTTVAEGVETMDQLVCVMQKGCMQAQGYFFGRPAPSEADACRIAGFDGACVEAPRHGPRPA
ncbi:bifunctional diguanylate cyclase/phosphodiesterase [Bordetella sp. FB-8]|uniref:putative bifunctional diguanylate cyclase/phosphodiesterase n=1 Tax=Bordetella sp. FB-8 TaxID=1159870 RepID=UPI0003A6F184|nr:EAL domain-containing protein [Bordetella sp. FB-8]